MLYIEVIKNNGMVTQLINMTSVHVLHHTHTFYYVVEEVLSLPIDSIPVNVKQTTNEWTLSQQWTLFNQPWLQSVPPHIPPISFFVSFPSFVSSQADYITQYYTKFDFDHSQTIDKIYNLITTDTNIFLATESDSIPQKDLLGFVIAKEDGTHLFMCYGQPAWIDTHSYRAEIWALLAGSQILTLLVEYYNAWLCKTKKFKARLKLITDSKSTMTKIKSMNK